MIKISAVSYLNTYPFIYGINKSELEDKIDLILDYPAVCAEKLLKGEVDLALVPVVAIPKLEEAHIISDFCIGADGVVDTVCLYSDIPIQQVDNIFLDYQSRTSIALLRILIKEYWQIQPEFRKLELGDKIKIRKEDAVLVIGDRAFNLNNQYEYVYDLSLVWKNMTGLPFVFALWVANKRLPADFIIMFNEALRTGVNSINQASFLQSVDYPDYIDLQQYLNQRISYDFNIDKKKAMDLFLAKL